MPQLTRNRVVLATLFGLGLLLPSQPASAQIGNFCPFGPCNFSHPTIVNVYWDSSPAQWNLDVGGPSSGMTQAQIDAFTTALVRSSYFSQLTQYGVTSVSMQPSITIGSCGTLPANVDAAIADIEALILCALTHAEVVASDQTIINVFLPPQVVNTGFCNVVNGLSASGVHGHSEQFASPLWTILPTTSACNGSLASLLATMTHEIVEAATDPEPQSLSGWKVPADGEIADLCSTSTPLAFGVATTYWSNSAAACVTGFATATAPAVTSSSICGTGRDMRVVLNGSFGTTPWDLASNPFATQSLYLRATISRPPGTGLSSWTAGNALGSSADTVLFQRVTWVPGGGPAGADQIRIFGFSGGYGTSGKSVRPGDTVTIRVENPANGARTTAAVVAPSAAVVSLTAAPDMVAGTIGGVTATAKDGAGCLVENVRLDLSTTRGTIDTPVTTGPLGTASAKVTYPDIAGPVTIRAITPQTALVVTRVHPRIDSIAPARGDASGGQVTVLSGLGFDSSTQVTMGASAATVQATTLDHKRVTLRTPPSALAGGIGPVGIAATVNGVSAYGLQYDYLQADVPVMEFLGGLGSTTRAHSCDTGQIRVSAFDAAGALEQTSISLDAGYGAFSSGAATRVVVQSGSTVTIVGSGPITATNLNATRAVATESFPVWPQDLCDGIAVLNGKIRHVVAGKAMEYRAFEFRAPAVQTIFWGDAEDATRSTNLVWMQGTDTAALKNAYDVLGVSEESQRALVAKNAAVAVRAKVTGTAMFVGPMIEIKSRAAANRPTPLSAPAHVSFAVRGGGAPGTYAIVHLRAVGDRLAWVEESQSVAHREGGVITSVAESTGTYALVQLVSKPPRPGRVATPAKRR